MEIYGKQIRWSTAGAPNPMGGICENFNEERRGGEEDHPEAGQHAAHVLFDAVKDLSWTTKLGAGSKVPVLATTGGCKVAVTGYDTGGVLFSEIVEEWGVRSKRGLSARATHYPDLAPGGSAAAADLADLEELAAQPICLPEGKVGWGTGGVRSALGIVQRFRITQRVRHNPYSEEGEIVTVVAALYEVLFSLTVIAVPGAVLPARGDALALATAPARFQAGNYIQSASEGYQEEDGVTYDISARWTPALP